MIEGGLGERAPLSVVSTTRRRTAVRHQSTQGEVKLTEPWGHGSLLHVPVGLLRCRLVSV